MSVKNNVTRMLAAKNVQFSSHQLPPEKLGAMEAAAHLGVSPELVYKTLVVTRPQGGKPVLAVVAGPSEVDLKALARTLDEKKVTLASHREAEELTGLQTGGISPLALLNRGFQVVLDDSAWNQDEIYISGGQRGVNIRLSSSALIELTGGITAPISRPSP